MKQTVVFKINVEKKYGKFALASNFIYKMQNDRSDISLEEVEGITSGIYQQAGQMSTEQYRKIARWVIDSEVDFKEIRYPEKLHISINKIYCLEVKEDSISDITELQYYILIKKYFKQIPIFLVLSGSDAFYHKISHYLYSIGSANVELYNSVVFIDNKNNIKRLQQKNIGALSGFYPLQFIDRPSVELFTKRVCEFFHEEDFKQMLTYKYKEIFDRVPLELRGSISLWHSCYKLFDEQTTVELYDALKSTNILTFLIMSYSLKYMQINDGRIKNWLGYLKQIQEYAIGVHQLAENIIQHSDTGIGVLSIKTYKSQDLHLSSKYGDKVHKQSPYLEIAVTDYSASNEKGNIADTFINRLEIKEKKLFENIQPVDFFNDRREDASERSREIQSIFDEYYNKKENIGRHFGLQIFKNVVQKNSGIFACYSHKSHMHHEGEEYGVYAEAEIGTRLQMPGTGYVILLPLDGNTWEIKRSDTNIETFIDTEKRADAYINQFKYYQKTLEARKIELGTRLDKQNLIDYFVEQFSVDHINESDKERTVCYVNCNGLKGEYGEYICKALLKCELYYILPDYVFYECGEEFVEIFRKSMNIYFQRNASLSLVENDYTIVLYTSGRMQETVICPNNYEKTYLLNKMSSFARGNNSDLSWLKFDTEPPYPQNEKIEIVPYDILFPVDFYGRKMTIFEQYTLHVLETDIQDKLFGCKIYDTHMRLGSTIHIDSFYEAELLFSNKMFISRFAFLLAKQIESDIKEFGNHKKITLYSYALYSELFIFEVMNILKNMHEEIDIDYMILEREAEHRDYSHMDRIRYSKKFNTENERREYFCDRKLITVVPITSTLKTHTKLLELFEKANSSFEREQILKNYAIVLVGSKKENKYWKIDPSSKLIKNEKNSEDTNHQEKLIEVKYMIEVKVDYQEAIDCKMCFPPDKPLNELPLIEVNAASTIPNQAFGLYKTAEIQKYGYDFLKEEEEKLAVLEDYTIYAHSRRGEKHYLYYFKTDEFFIAQKSEIKSWLENLDIKVNPNEYHILFSPAHFSNAGFLEYINKYVFHDAALIIRADIDKEYRSNLASKYSNIGVLLKYLEQDITERKVVRVYYVDDSIITGRTYFRSKSILSTAFNIYGKKYENITINLFDKIFVLIDRNSNQSKMQYVNVREEKDAVAHQFYSYMQVNISSLRNHGNSCVICQLQNDADRLYHMSATRPMAEYWKESRNKFEVKPLEDKQSEKEVEKEQSGHKDAHSSFRRLYCTHMASTLLSEKNHGNHKEIAVGIILNLLLTDYRGRKNESEEKIATEYFLSYLKVISRPFIVFNKSVKEAIFDILLVISDLLLDATSTSVDDILQKADKKRYLLKYKESFGALKEEILDNFVVDEEKCDILLLLIKQLTELKSNYYIRRETISKIRDYIKQFPDNLKNDFYERYLRSIKKLLENNSDTSKSAWFNQEMTCVLQDEGWNNLPLPQKVFLRLIIENTRSYYNGIYRLSKELPYMTGDIFNAHRTETTKKEAENILLNSVNSVAYRDFKKTLTDDQMITVSDAKETLGEKELYSILSNIEMLKDLQNYKDSENEETILEICSKLAIYIRNILRAAEVQMMIEIPMECDEWREELKRKYNNMAQKCFEKSEWNDCLLKYETRSDYLLLANGRDRERKESYVNTEIIECLREYRKESRNLGFWINDEKKYLIWEFGQKSEHQILLYAKWKEEILPNYLKSIRYAMSNYYQLNDILFSKARRAHIHEFLLAEKDSLVYNQEKAHTHTESGIRMNQHGDVQNDKNDTLLYRSHVMTLLADLAVSNVYRKSLKRGYYNMWSLNCIETKSSEIFDLYKKNSQWLVIKPEVGGHLCISVKMQLPDGMSEVQGIQEIDGTEKVLCMNVCTARKEIQLLMHALIMNVARTGRGKSNRIKNSMGEEIDEKSVYLVKTEDGCLRIINETNDSKIPIETINTELKYPPRDEKHGISLWSVSRYFRVIWNIKMRKYLENIEKNLERGEDECITILKRAKRKIEIYLENDSIGVKCGTLSIQGKDSEMRTYFYTDVPMFEEKYISFFGKNDEV